MSRISGVAGQFTNFYAKQFALPSNRANQIGLWEGLSRDFVKEVSRRLDISSEDLKSGVSDGFSRFKSFLDEKRTDKGQQSE